MTIDKEAKDLLVGSYVSNYNSLIKWTYQPGLTNDSYPKNLYIHQLTGDGWIVQVGKHETMYSSFEDCLKACLGKVEEYTPNSIAKMVLVDNRYLKILKEVK